MPDDPAKTRFLILTAIRFGGVILALAGAAILSGKVDLPREAGMVLLVIGAIDVLLIPPLLLRRWKTPPR